MSIRASVIVPAYNAASTIEECLEALVRQTEPQSNYEIVVVDDGSTDGTADRARAFGAVRVLSACHRGPAAARNLGARLALGDVLLFTDADCAPSEAWVSELLKALQDPSIVGAKGTYRTRQTGAIARFVQLEYQDKYARMSRAATIDFVDTYSAAYRRDVFLSSGGFDESFPSASVEDQELSFRLAKQGYRMVFAPRAIVYHRHPSTLVAYARRKFRIGFWKVRVHRRHPSKAWRDSHTPPVLKVQVGFFLAAVASLTLAPFWSHALVLAGLCLAAVEITAVPLIAFMTRRDRAAALAAPGMVLVRAAALGSGLVAGAVGEIARSVRLKRLLDVLGGLMGMVLFAPLMLLIAIAIKLDSPGPVFFTQMRSGENGRPFRIIKFRSMVEGAEAMLDSVMAQSCLPPPVFKIPNDGRVTRVGKILRRFSLDELPQFINVLKGEMSLVGPRPEELRIVSLYSDWHFSRLAIKPGMTGPMQTDGRGMLSLDDRVRLEIDYIEHYSLWQDLKLLVKTVPAVIRGSGAY